MPAQFTVLASGSSGNAAVLEVDGFGLLVDFGLGPRTLARRLHDAGLAWNRIHAVILTHTHSDHCQGRTLAHLFKQRIPLYCHRDHFADLRRECAWFAPLHAAKLVRCYSEGTELILSSTLRCRPLPVSHDSGATFGFRFEGDGSLFSGGWTLGYVADLGCWHEGLVDALRDCHLLALEFNHDVNMQRTSGRHPRLISRVLGDFGHLSNVQGAALLEAVLCASRVDRVGQVVQLHLSRQCNRPELALDAAQSVCAGGGHRTSLHTARHDTISPTFSLGALEPAPALAAC